MWWLIWACIVVGQIRPERGAGKPEVGREIEPVSQMYWISTSGSWTTGSSWSGGVAPTAGDVAILDGRSQVSVITGLGTLGAPNQVGLVYTTPEYTGNLGTAGEPLAIEGSVQNAGSGSFHLTASNLVAGVEGTIVSDTHNLVDGLIIHYVSHSDILLYVRAGYVELLGPNSVYSTYPKYMWIEESRGRSVVVLGNRSTTGFQDLVVRGGHVTLRGAQSATAGGNVSVSGGTLLVDDDNALTRWVTVTGGVFDYRSTATITRLNCIGGLTDFTGDYRAKTVSSLTIGTGAEVLLHNKVTVTAPWGSSTLFDLNEDLPSLP